MRVEKIRDPNGKDLGWRVTKQDNDPHQQIIPKWVAQMEKESPGFVQKTEDAFILNTVDGPKVFRILEEPGSYCIHCGDRIEDARTTGEASRAHVQEQHANAPVNIEHPCGYRVSNTYLTIME